jgi:hypothetical protein
VYFVQSTVTEKVVGVFVRFSCATLLALTSEFGPS